MYVDEDTETRNYIKELVDMDENKPVYSKADRQMIILLELLTINEPLKYFYFTSLFHISDATLSNDLEEVETWLDHYNLTLYRRPGMGILLGRKRGRLPSGSDNGIETKVKRTFLKSIV